ncbi:MAG: divalent-cation tolerance protein CutA [Propionibacteriaceae bacterium]|jgi:periplasmic divalent cation tolerance protein
MIGYTEAMMEPICEVIITADDEDWLIMFTRSLIEDRLAACGQHSAPIRSIYRWDGSIHDDREVRVALHTRASLVSAILARVRREHSYEVPCVLAIPVETGNLDYISWVVQETDEPAGDDQA